MDYEPPRPVGSSEFDLFLRWIWDNIKLRLRLIDTPQVKWQYTNKGIIGKFNIHPGGISGWRWASPVIYDQTKVYQKNEIVLIRPGDDIVINGSTDIDTHAVRKAYAGLWVAMQTVDGGTDVTCHVPQWPLPTEGEPSSVGVYWMLISLYPMIIVDCTTPNGTTLSVTNAQTQH